MKLFLTALLVVAATAVSDKDVWESFKTEHNKVYKNVVEEKLRYNIFLDNLKKIEEHNAKYEKGEVGHKLAVNKFADLTQEEFKAKLTYKKADSSKKANHQVYVKPVNADVPDSVDWRDKGAVTPVKDQGQCGGCWAFAVVAATEGAYFLKNNKLVSLSEQELIDCGTPYGLFGCDGGLLDPAFQYIEDNGIESEDDYPFVAEDQTCAAASNKVVTKIATYVDVEQENEDDLVSAVATVGPVAVAIDASYLQFYSSGIYDGSDCSTSYLDHAVTAIGYAAEGKQNYWIIKNSWGLDWGEKGYFRMARGSNACGIAEEPSYPTL